MLGLFGTFNMVNRALQTQRHATEVAGHNLANVNTPGFSRQRVAIESSIVRLTQTQTAYQAALQSAGRILGSSLPDYLR